HLPARGHVSQVVGERLGEVQPPRPKPIPQPDDGRFAALKAWRAYLASEVTFYRRAAKGKPPRPFRLPEKNILLEQPDDPKELVFPSISIIGSTIPIEPDALGAPFAIDESRDVYGPG